MKRLCCLMATLATVACLMAVPAKRNVWKTATLADGTTISVRLVGDEHLHYWKANDGRTFMEQDNGLFAPVDVANMRPNKIKGTTRRSRQTRAKAFGTAQKTNTYTGQRKGLIILAEFSDVHFKAAHTQKYFEDVANKENFKNDDGFEGSVYDYFKAQSGGKFLLTFDVVGPIRLKNKMAYYGGNNSNDEDQHPEEMVVEACNAVADKVDFSTYDWDKDGEADQVFVLYAGKGEADSGIKNTIWPHEWQLSSSTEVAPLTIKGTKIDTYACSNELDDADNIAGIGTICHEFTHCLGLPDFYDTNSEGYFGMGDFDLMCSGSYNGDTFRPAGYTSYEKIACGWLTPKELSADSAITNLKPISDGGDAYIVRHDTNANEYYLIENRQPTNWDDNLPGKGLMITHVDYDATIWENNRVNSIGDYLAADGYTKDFSNDHERLTIFHADNDDDKKYWDEAEQSYTDMTEEGDLYPYDGNNSLTNNSSPKAMVYNASKDGSHLMNKGITGITQNDDGTMSFNFQAVSKTEAPIEPGQSGNIPEGDVLWYESFDKCAGKGGNDGKFSAISGQAELATDLTGWESDNANGAYQCARFGTSKKSGVVKTPSFDVDGTAVLVFKAASWDTKAEKASLDIYKEGAAFSDTHTPINIEKGKWNTYSYTITGKGNLRICLIGNNRFFLDEVKVIKPATNGITSVGESTAKETRIYNISGQYVGSDLNRLPSGLYIVNGKKVVK